MTPAREPSRLPPPPTASSAQLAADVLVLLKRGRVAVALAQLERLPELFRDELTEAAGQASWAGYRRGWEAGRAALAAEIVGDAKPKRPRTPRRHEWLAVKIADPAKREIAKVVLRLSDELLDAIAEGGVGLGPSSWRKLRRELGR
jgi:hypothetical protein